MKIIDKDNSTSLIMLKVVLSTVPAAIVMTHFFGWGVLQNLGLAVVFCCLSEAILVFMRGESVLRALSDGSAVLTGILLGFSLPPYLDIQLILLACLFAIALVKQLYGGLGQNIFNPAMMGYALLLISFPSDMAAWSTLDATSGATLLDQYKQSTVQPDIAPIFPAVEQTEFYWVNLAFALGGVYLLFAKLITWHLPVAFLLGIFSLSSVLYVLGSDSGLSPLAHLMSGATMIGAFFIVTDPVTAATSRKGQLIYGFIVGLLVVIIRQWSVYPDGVAFAVLLMNMCVPVLDYFTRPTVALNKAK